jgi:hypothetical protein
MLGLFLLKAIAVFFGIQAVALVVMLIIARRVRR